MTSTTRRGPNTPDGSHSSHGDNRRNVQTARPCFYADFMKCQPLNFKGTEGVVGLTRWIEKMESVFNISGCAVENQVQRQYAMSWEVLHEKDVRTSIVRRAVIKKLEIELWNLKVKGNDVPAYTECFQELTLICTKFFANETEKVDKYIGGLPDNIYGNVKKLRPTGKASENKRKVMIHPETANRPPTATLQRGIMSPKSSQHGDNAKGSLMVNTGNTNVCLHSEGHWGNSQGNGMGMHKDGFNAVGNARRGGNCTGKPLMRMSSQAILSNIDLMLVELGSFDVIIDMDWLRRCHAVIVCDEKLVQYYTTGVETFDFLAGNESRQRERTPGCRDLMFKSSSEHGQRMPGPFIALISARKRWMSQKQITDKGVSIRPRFSEVFPGIFAHGLPHSSTLWNSIIELIPGAAPDIALSTIIEFGPGVGYHCYGDLRSVIMARIHQSRNILFHPEFRDDVPRCEEIIWVANMNAGPLPRYCDVAIISRWIFISKLPSVVHTGFEQPSGVIVDRTYKICLLLANKGERSIRQVGEVVPEQDSGKTRDTCLNYL
ncbi:hypothetical protein Tco_0967199 [Tanacetum coccineum]